MSAGEAGVCYQCVRLKEVRVMLAEDSFLAAVPILNLAVSTFHQRLVACGERGQCVGLKDAKHHL